jgi:hypothetical protein
VEPPAVADEPPRDIAGLSEGERASAAAGLEAYSVRGTLVYTDLRRGCRLEAVRLPELTPAPVPRGVRRGCRFELSPNGRRIAPAHAAWLNDESFASCVAGVTRIEVPATRDASATLAIAGCEPALRPRPARALTLVRHGEVIEVDAECGEPVPCERVLVRAPLIEAAAETHPNVSPENGRPLDEVEVADMAWLSPTRLALLLRLTIDGAGEQDLVAVVEGGRIRGSYYFFDTERDSIEVSPRGRRGWSGGSFAFTAEGPRLGIPDAFGAVRAAAWSPDEEWVALAGRNLVAFVAAGDSAAPRVATAPIDAGDLAWR